MTAISLKNKVVEFGGILHINPETIEIDVNSPLVIDIEDNENNGFVGIGWTQDGKNIYYSTNLTNIKPYLEQCLVRGHNLKYDMHMLNKWGINVSGGQIKDDTYLMAHIIDSIADNDLKSLAKQYLGLEWIRYKDLVIGKGKQKQTLDKHPIEDVAEYCGCDVLATSKLLIHLTQNLTSSEREYYNTELKLQQMTFEMERKGVRIDKDYLHELDLEYQKRVQEKAQFFLDESVNPNSPKQLLPFLQQQIKGITATNEKHLRKYHNHPLIKRLLNYRETKKLHSTYIEALLKENRYGKIHGKFHLTGTWTGRLCVDPETLIEAPRNLSKYPNGIPLYLLNKGDYVYSLDWEKRLCLKKILWIGPTQIKDSLQITVKNQWGKITRFICSKDHLIRMFHGGWRNAGTLKIGQRLCGFVRRGIDEYAYFFPSSKRRQKGESGGKSKEHRWILAQLLGYKNLPAKWDVHHIDGNKLNNTPENLQKVMHSAHVKMHNPGYSKEALQKMLETNDIKLNKKYFKRRCKQLGLIATNHTIVQIDEVGKRQLWDLEVEDTHTFFGGEIALHNSSSSPNLQNQPRGSLIRTAFLSESQEQWVKMDYSQLELRMLAHLSNDQALIEAFNSGQDLHQFTAHKLYKIPVDQVTPDQRQKAKAINFGIAYGKTEFGLADELQISLDEAKDIIDGWWNAYIQASAFKTRLIYKAKNDGYITTIFGIRRRIRGIEDWCTCGNRKCKKCWRTKAMSRELMSAMIAGSAADIVKKAMAEVGNRGYLPLLQVHDELDFSFKKNSPQIDEVKNIMENIVKLNVPLVVDVHIGDNWGQCK